MKPFLLMAMSLLGILLSLVPVPLLSQEAVRPPSTAPPQQEGGKVVNGLRLTLAWFPPQNASEEPKIVENRPEILDKYAYYGTRFKVHLTNVGKGTLKIDNLVLVDGLSIRLQGEDGNFAPQSEWGSKRTLLRQFLYLKPGEAVEAEELHVWDRVKRPAKAGKYRLWVAATTELEGAEALKDDPKKADLHAVVWKGTLDSNQLKMRLPAAPKEITDAKAVESRQNSRMRASRKLH